MTSPTVAPSPSPIKGLPISWLITGSMLLCIVLLVASVIVLNNHGARDEAVLQATKTTQSASRLLTEQARRMLEPAEATVRQLAFDPLVTATSLEERLQRLHPLAKELRANPLLAAIYVGYDNGDFILVRLLENDATRKLYEAPAQAEFVVQSIQTNADGIREGNYLFYSINHELLLQRPQADYRFEPRARPWYQLAVKQLGVAVSEPFVFASSQQIGITVSQKSRLGETVVAADIVLDELAQSLAALRTARSTQIVLIDTESQVLAHSNMSRALRQQGKNMVFSSLQELNEPALTALASKKPGAGLVDVYEIRGKEWLGVSMPFKGLRIDGLRLLVATPSSDLIDQMQRHNTQVVALLAGLGVLMLPLVWWTGTLLGRKLASVSGRALRLGNFDFAKPQQRNSLVREVNTLAESLETMGAKTQALLEINHILLTEPKLQAMLDAVLEHAVPAAQTDAGVVFLWDEATETMAKAASFGKVPEDVAASFAYPAGRSTRTQVRVLSTGQQQLEWVLHTHTATLLGMLVLLRDTDKATNDTSGEAFGNRVADGLAPAIAMRQLPLSHPRS